jgi:hypothetical protein
MCDTRSIFASSHILDKRLPVDISVFCDYLDQMCTVISVDNRLKRYDRLNDVMLPRNWLLQLVRHPQNTPKQQDFHGLLKKLLSQLPNMLDLLAREDDVMQGISLALSPTYYLSNLCRMGVFCRHTALQAWLSDSADLRCTYLQNVDTA